MLRPSQKSLTIGLLLAPATAFFALAVLVTIVYSVYISGTDWNINVSLTSRAWVGTQNYVHLLHDPVFLHSILNALLVALVSVFVQIPLAIVVAVGLARIKRGAGALRYVLFIPVLLSSTVVAQLWRFIYSPNSGLLNRAIHIIDPSGPTIAWLGDPSTALAACIVPGVWQWWGFFMLIIYGAVKSIPNELLEAAKVDGAGEFVAVRSVVLPLVQPVIKNCVILTVAGSLRVFDTIWVMTQGGPLNATQVPATLVFRYVFMEGRFGYGSGVAVFLVLESLLIALLIQQIFRARAYEY